MVLEKPGVKTNSHEIFSRENPVFSKAADSTGQLYVLGIDFGTSNTCVCQATYQCGADGTVVPQPVRRPAPVMVQTGETVPTVLFLGTADEPAAYGELAEEKSLYSPRRADAYDDLIKAQFKPDLGRPGAAGVEAYQHTRRFLQFLRGRLTECLPFEDHERIKTFLGHPVQWTADQRRLLLQAAVEAGFPNVTIEDEASAAVSYHLCEQLVEAPRGRSSRLLVVDMGAGTTDFAMVELPAAQDGLPVTIPVDPHRLVRAWDGVNYSYGGRDVDVLLRNELAGRLGYDRSSRHWAFLLRETRRFKEQFSLAVGRGQSEYSTHWLVDDSVQEVRLTRHHFEQMARSYIEHLPRLIHATLALEGLRPHQVDGVILTGGSSRWYWVEAAVRSICPHLSLDNRTLVAHTHPEQSVARGLAYSQMISALGERPRSRRRAVHGLWLASPENSRDLKTSSQDKTGTEKPASPNVALAKPQPELTAGSRTSTITQGGGSAISDRAAPDPEHLAPVMERGALLPFTTPEPATFYIERVSFDCRKALLDVRLYTGSSACSCEELLSQLAVFKRPRGERLLKRLSQLVPWSTGYDRDQFAVELLCTVEENELLAGQLTIRRLRRSKAIQEVVQAFRIGPGPGKTSPLFLKAAYSEPMTDTELFTGTNPVSYAAHHERMAVR